jgi:hypothetical protein
MEAMATGGPRDQLHRIGTKAWNYPGFSSQGSMA